MFSHTLKWRGLMLVSGLCFLVAATWAPAQTLINVNFGAAPDGNTSLTNKTGMAATGMSPQDQWNYYYRNDANPTLNLRWANGTDSGASLTLANAYGSDSNGTADLMYQSFIYTSGDNNMTLTVNGLTDGYYAFYLYGHGGSDNQDTIFDLGGTSQATTTGSDWSSSTWTAGQQYVLFTNILVSAGSPVSVTIRRDASVFAFINGLQIVKYIPTNDGISSTWRTAYFGTNYFMDARSAATADPDGDGANNYQEFLANTHPLNAGQANSHPVTASSFAGIGGVSGNLDGYRTNATFGSLSPMAIDPQGRLWIGDTTSIRIMDTNGNITTYAGTNVAGMVDGPVASARFQLVNFFVFDTDGNAFLTDRLNHRIRKIDTNGIVSTFAGSTQGFQNGTGTGAQFSMPIGLTIDPSNNLYVADFYNYRIRKITPAGVVTTFAGTGGAGTGDGAATNATFNSPTMITRTPDGNMYVSDWSNGRIRKISTSNTVSTIVTGLSYLDQMMSDASGYLYTLDSGARQLRKYSTNGVLQWVFAPGTGMQDGPVANAKFGGPLGQPMPMPDGSLLIADANNYRLVKLSMAVDPPLAISPASILFTNSIVVTVTTNVAGASIRYTLDGSDPVTNSLAYTAPFTLTQSATVKVRLFKSTVPVSEIVSAMYTAGYLYAVNDGIPASWRQQYFGAGYQTDPRVAADADPDGDGQTNYQEYLAGTDPLNAASVPRGPVTVSTYAGNGTTGMKDGFRTDATFGNFSPLAQDPQGRVWIADPTAIRIVDLNGNLTTYIGTNVAGMVDGSATNARFQLINSIVFDTQGNTFVTDRLNHRIRKIDPNGVVSTFAGSSTAGAQNGTGTNAQFNMPIGLTIDSSNNLYVADFNNYRIRMITPQQVVTTLTGSGPGSQDGSFTNATFNSPTMITRTPDGNLYVSDWSNGKVRRLGTNGIVSTIVSGLSYLDQIIADSAGDLLVVDNGRRQLSKFSAGGTLLWRLSPGQGFQDGAAALSKFGSSLGQPLPMPDGSVLVSDPSNYRVRQITIGVDPGLTISPSSGTFTNTVQVTIGSSFSTNAIVRYTLNGADPATNSAAYSAPFTLSNSVTIKARAYVNNYPVSSIISQSFNRVVDFVDGIPNSWRLQYFGAGYTNDPNAAAAADPDGDGTTNFQEYLAGTDPTNVASVLKTPQSVSTYAGTGAGDQNGYRTNIGLAYLSAVRYDAQGRLWIGDAYRIRIIDTDGNVTTYAGANHTGYVDGPVADAQFGQIDAIVFDSQGNAFVNDRFNNCIRKIDVAAGTVSTFAGSTAGFQDDTGTNAKFDSPIGLAIDANDNLYAADFNNHRVRKITPAGVVTTLVGNGAPGSQNGDIATATITSPTSVCVAQDGTVFVTEWSAGRVRRIGAANVTTVISGLSYLDQVNIDSSGNLYVVDNGRRQLTRYKQDGTLLWMFAPGSGLQDGPIASAKFGSALGQPLPLANGDVLISDAGNYRLCQISMGIDAGLTIYPASTLFTNTLFVTVSNRLAGTQVRYTVDGSVPGPNSPVLGSYLALSNSATVTMRAFVSIYPVSAPVSATYTMAFLYAVNDGIPASWRQQYFGAGYQSDPRVAADADPDGDGLTNYQEYLAGTDPLNANSMANVPVSVSTYAGTGVSGNLDGFRTNATFDNFSPLAMDSQGRLWIGDATAIRIMDAAGNVTTYAGTNVGGMVDGAATSARFQLVNAFVFDAQGNTFLTDRLNHRIRKIDSNGVVSTFAGSSAGYLDGTGTNAMFNMPIGLTIDPAGNLYVADFNNYRVRKITPQGVVTTLAGSGPGSQDGSFTNATFNSPTMIARTADGTLFVSDWANGKIRKLGTNGVVSTIVSGLSYLDQVNADAAGNLYVVDNGRRQLSKFTSGGTLLWRLAPSLGFQDGPATTAKFGSALGQPLPLANGNLLVSDAGNFRIRLVTMGVDPGIVISPASTLFTNSVSVTISNNLGGSIIRFTLTGSDPTTNSSAYSAAFVRTNETTVKARAYVNGYPVSPVVSRTFSRIYALANDGIPDGWRQQYFGAGFLTNPLAAADADPDGDGISNLQEYFSGSDPLNALSGFAVTIRLAPVVSWNSIPDSRYRIWRKDSIGSTNKVIVNASFTATNSLSSYVDLSTTNNSSFYIIEVVP